MDKLAVSNIAWTDSNEKVFKLLSDIGVSGVEVAPGKVAGGWEGLDVKSMQAYRTLCADFGLVIPSFQAFLFGKPELQLLGDEKSFVAFTNHMKFIAELAQTAGAKVLVYGAPKNRLLLEHSYDDGMAIAEERLAVLADICWDFEVSIGLEAVPAIYGGEIIKSYKESAAIVKAVNHPGLVFHLDTGCTFLNDESVTEAINQTSDIIRHFHISQPKLTDFSDNAKYHAEAAIILNKMNYAGWLCIEMLQTDAPLNSIQIAVDFVRNQYQNNF